MLGSVSSGWRAKSSARFKKPRSLSKSAGGTTNKKTVKSFALRPTGSASHRPDEPQTDPARTLKKDHSDRAGHFGVAEVSILITPSVDRTKTNIMLSKNSVRTFPASRYLMISQDPGYDWSDGGSAATPYARGLPFEAYNRLQRRPALAI